MLFVNKLKVLTLMACLVLVGQGFALDCATGTGWGDFLTQEASKPNGKTYYEIDTPEKLAWFACKVTNKSLSTEEFKLTKSLDMQGKLFIPIGSGTGEDTGFKGTFDGQGFTISNLYVNTSEINSDISGITGKSKNGVTAYAQNIGLFGILSNNATVKNLILKDVQIYAAASSGTTGLGSDKPISVGSLVGWVGATDKTVVKIENIVASGFIETSGATNRVGGIAGNVKHVTISNCVSSVSVTASGANTNVGGVVGAIRNDGNVTLTSCAYSGDHLYTVDGSIGAVAGSYENSKGTLTTENLYYSDDFCQEFENPDVCPGIGKLPNGKTFNTEKTENLNSEDIVCELNGGTWNEENKICEGDTSEVWSIGQSSLSMNGSDGYKITFNANGGVFASGAKTSKILSKNATITADEIGVPTREGKKFAGWATKADTTEPNPNLGVARAATTIYAVWYDFYTVSFETNPETHATETVQVPKHGTVSVEGFTVPATYTVADPQNPGTPIKYYFTGWGNRSKMLDVGVDPTAEDTVHLADIDVVDNVNLYAVWTKAKTFSVTFDATLHGKTDVRIIKIVNEGDPVSEPDPNDIISDAGYEVAGWCLVEACTESNEYDFDSPLEGNLLLYARWNVIQYSITYENMNGASNADNPSNYNVGSDEIVFAAPTKVGSVFEGWFYDAEFTNPATQIETGSTGDKTIYAKWMQITYTIQYLSGNTIYATAKNVTKNHGETIQLNGALDEFAHNGCSQDGWSRVDYGQDGYGIDYELGADYEDNANLKLFPHWTCNTYTITYEIFGASATNRNPTQYMGPAKLTLENAFDPAKKYFFMDNWYKEPTFKTAIRDVQNIDADLTLYARWYNKITYTPGSNVSGAKNLEEKKDFDKTYKFKTSIDKYVRANYTLDGWSLTDGGEKVYGLGDAYTTNANLTLYPHWVESRDSVQYGAVKIYTYATDGRKEAVINGNYTGTDAVEISSDISVKSVTLDRTFNAGKIATLFVPFEIDAENVAGTEVYKFKTVVKSDVDNRWKFKVSTATKIMPNTPYVIIPEGTQVTFDIPTSVTLNTTTEGEATAANNWEFIGAYQYEKFTIDNNNPIYLFANEERDGAKLGEFVKIAEGAFINPMRAYLVYHKTLAKSASGSLGSNILLPDELDIEIEDENGIVVQTGKLNTVTGEVRMDRWYDLKGRKLNSKPTVKGTYYKNGKRVIVK
jgi:uncharacterized repeat protein (TIGR02543 family)